MRKDTGVIDSSVVV